jgi:sRNA-binding regulator protein Hfq
MLIFIVAFVGMSLYAAQSVTFLKNGRSFTGTILDMSSRTGVVDYKGNTKFHRNNIWMINYADTNWNHPNERRRLSNKTDTIFLRNGHVLNVRIVDFSSRRKMYEFRKGGRVHESKVLRIYFCCTPLPQAYQQALKQPKPPQGGDKRYAAVFLMNGRHIEKTLSYLNSRKSGFTDGLQINTHDIWMINFANDKWNYADERRKLDDRLDTIFLKNGKVLYDSVVDFSSRRGTFRFENIDPIHESRIKRIYFCCNPLPDAYRRNRGRRPRR